jgi:hypothetical protein
VAVIATFLCVRLCGRDDTEDASQGIIDQQARTQSADHFESFRAREFPESRPPPYKLCFLGCIRPKRLPFFRGQIDFLRGAIYPMIHV